MARCADCDNGKRYCRNGCQGGKAYCPDHSGPYCKVCGGSGLVTCPYCKGWGLEYCESCDGKGYFPDEERVDVRNDSGRYDRDDSGRYGRDDSGGYDRDDQPGGSGEDFTSASDNSSDNSGGGSDSGGGDGGGDDDGGVSSGATLLSVLVAVPIHLYVTWHFTRWVMSPRLLAAKGPVVEVMATAFYSVIPGAVWFVGIVMVLMTLAGGKGAGRLTGLILKLGLAAVWGYAGHRWMSGSPVAGALGGAVAGVGAGAFLNQWIGGLAEKGCLGAAAGLVISVLLVLWAVVATL